MRKIIKCKSCGTFVGVKEECIEVTCPVCGVSTNGARDDYGNDMSKELQSIIRSTYARNKKWVA